MTQPASDQPLVALPAGTLTRCAECGADLALDQRYCVECGARRGTPRFRIAPQTSAGVTSDTTASRARALQPRLVPLLAAIALLLAVGVGFLIGDATRTQVRQPVRVTLTGGSPAGGASKGAASGSSGATSAGAKAGGTSTGSQKLPSPFGS